jgi:hypothetical protein
VPAKLTPEDRITALELHVFGGPPEVNQQIQVGDTMTIPITAEDAQQAVKPLLAGDTFMARSSDPLSLKAGIGAAKGGGPALIVQGLRAAVRVLAFVTDAKGLRQVVGRFDVVAPVPSVVTPPEPAVETEPVPVSLALDMGAAETEEPSPPSP